jgi:murein DD-endopeptidase MepM/ murein hydrolase activator NlpD
LYAAFFGQAASKAGIALPSELGGQNAAQRASGLESQLGASSFPAPRIATPLASRSAAALLEEELESRESSSHAQVLPPVKDIIPVPMPILIATPESRVETLNRNIKAPTPTATPRSAGCVPGESPAYCVYTVQEGDTLSSIAADFRLKNDHIPGWELLVASNRPDLTSADDFIQPGQKLRIPTLTGVVHTVILGETVGDLAEAFDVSSEDIVAANGITDRDLVRYGAVLLISDPRRIPSPVEPIASSLGGDPAAAPSPEPDSAAAPEPPAQQGPEGQAAPRVSPSGFIWPITATVRITSYFGPRHPLGIDLGLGHAPGSPVVAAAAGKVIFAGGDRCCSYGYYVIVDHENGLKTLYAHLSRISVSVGERVAQGQTLGPSGTTGYSTGVHLHFEVHKNGVRVNPLPYLP